MAALNVTLVAADGKVWEGEASQVVAPAEEGPMGILPGHAPMLVALGEGEVRIDGVSGRFSARCEGGFATIDGDKVTLAVDNADTSSDQA